MRVTTRKPGRRETVEELDYFEWAERGRIAEPDREWLFDALPLGAIARRERRGGTVTEVKLADLTPVLVSAPGVPALALTRDALGMIVMLAVTCMEGEVESQLPDESLEELTWTLAGLMGLCDATVGSPHQPEDAEQWWQRIEARRREGRDRRLREGPITFCGYEAHPGDVLEEFFLKPRGLSAGALAKRLGVPRSRVESLMARATAVTPDMALRLARAFGTTDEVWLDVQSRWDLGTARAALDVSAIEPLDAPADAGAGAPWREKGRPDGARPDPDDDVIDEGDGPADPPA